MRNAATIFLRLALFCHLAVLAVTQAATDSGPSQRRLSNFQSRPYKLQGHQRENQGAAASSFSPSSSSSSQEQNDDSDMYLEPDEQPDSQQTAKSSELVSRYEYGAENNNPDHQAYSQHFFPTFAPLFSLGHSRPPQLYHQVDQPQIPFYKPPPRPPQFLRAELNPFRSLYKETNYQAPLDTDEEASTSLQNNLLGSGNFGVLKGGTFFGEGESGSYFNNGHSRPVYGNPRPQKGGDFFHNFRDFADINMPTKASFSEYVIVYVNQNGTENPLDSTDTKDVKVSRPKNIIEQLNLLGNEEKKISLHKKKLSRFQQDTLNKLQKVKRKEIVKEQEPLLALS